MPAFTTILSVVAKFEIQTEGDSKTDFRKRVQ
jgi:hypothetical protein